MSVGELRVTIRVIDRFSRQIAKVGRVFRMFSWWMDWQASYGNPKAALRLIEARWLSRPAVADSPDSEPQP